MKDSPAQISGYYDQSGRCRLNTLKGFFLQDIDKILYVTASGNYSVIHLVSGDERLITYTISYVQSLLEKYGFKRIGRSKMINLNYLSHVDRQRSICLMEPPSGRVEISISQRHIKELSLMF